MLYDLDQYEGKKFCVVLVQEIEENDTPGSVRMRPLHGRASIDKGVHLNLVWDGGKFGVPRTCYNRIMPSDGTEMLRDAEYFVIVKVDPKIEI